jgi:hypothetical protein
VVRNERDFDFDLVLLFDFAISPLLLALLVASASSLPRVEADSLRPDECRMMYFDMNDLAAVE